MKPSWNDAPEWANWLAMSDVGVWTWFEKEPSISYGMGYYFAEHGGEWEDVINDMDWTDSLESKPNNI